MIQQAHNNLKKTKQKLTNLENLESPISPTAAPLSQKIQMATILPFIIIFKLKELISQQSLIGNDHPAIVIQRGLCNA